MLDGSGFAKGGLAGHGDAHAVLRNALADKSNGYRHQMRPADIIAQNLSERRPRPAAGLSQGVAGLLRKLMRFEFRP